MARTLITQSEVNGVEVYWHRLRQFIDVNHQKLTSEQKRRLLYEHRVMEMNITLIDNLMGGRGCRIVAKNIETRENYFFGNQQVAEIILDVPVRQIQRVLSGERASAHGWIFNRVEKTKNTIDSKMNKFNYNE